MNPGSLVCGPNVDGIGCRSPWTLLHVLSCYTRQVCSGMSLPFRRHLFLFAGTLHSLCLLLIKGHPRCRAFISCSERMYFSWKLSAKCLSHSFINERMDSLFTCLPLWHFLSITSSLFSHLVISCLCSDFCSKEKDWSIFLPVFFPLRVCHWCADGYRNSQRFPLFPRSCWLSSLCSTSEWSWDVWKGLCSTSSLLGQMDASG